jgi:peptidoglycan/LPS O-acetylase OafA/YrhL
MIKNQTPSREAGLDILRGIMASSVMLYHFGLWHHFSDDASLLINKLGIYAVSVFFVLSGATFFLVYQNTDFRSLQQLKYFWIKRFFRIFPLFWLVSLLSIPLAKNPITGLKYFLNFTGLFSVVDLSAHLCTGGWSIGVELCFYLMFPVLLLVFQKNTLLFYILFMISVLINLYFGFFALDSDQLLPKQWSVYINTFNHLLFFMGGMLLGIWHKKIMISQQLCWLFTIIIALAFVYLPANRSIDLVTDTNRIYLTLLSLVFCFFFLKLHFPTHLLGKLLRYLGEVSYSIYLVHPLIFVLNSPVFKHLAHFIQIDPVLKVGVLALETIVFCGFVYYFFEKKMIAIGNTIVSKMKLTDSK